MPSKSVTFRATISDERFNIEGECRTQVGELMVELQPFRQPIPDLHIPVSRIREPSHGVLLPPLALIPLLCTRSTSSKIS